jgi:hypothetical protein
LGLRPEDRGPLTSARDGEWERKLGAFTFQEVEVEAGYIPSEQEIWIGF